MPHLSDISTIEPDTDALDSIPESLVREASVLLISVSDESIHVILPNDEKRYAMLDKLEFVFARKITHDTADREQILEQIARHYPRPNAKPEDLIEVILPVKLPKINLQADYHFLDLTGRVTQSTPSSVCFKLGHVSNVLELSDGSRHEYDRECVFHNIGWLDAHYPCRGFHKLMIRCSLPRDYMSWETMRELAACVAKALALPSAVPFEVHLVSCDFQMHTVHPSEIGVFYD